MLFGFACGNARKQRDHCLLEPIEVLPNHRLTEVARRDTLCYVLYRDLHIDSLFAKIVIFGNFTQQKIPLGAEAKGTSWLVEGYW
jgi:hypothetical protein